MSGESQEYGQPIFNAADPRVQEMLVRMKENAAKSDDHHRRERVENFARTIEGKKEERRPAEG